VRREQLSPAEAAQVEEKMPLPVLTVDVAHPPRHPDVVEEELIEAWSKIRNSPSLRILKIIHGRGASGRGGSTRDIVRNWAFRQQAKCRAVIEGESYTLSDRRTQELRREVGQFPDDDLDGVNSGITILWIK
jgi:hypothetical protein